MSCLMLRRSKSGCVVMLSTSMSRGGGAHTLLKSQSTASVRLNSPRRTRTLANEEEQAVGKTVARGIILVGRQGLRAILGADAVRCGEDVLLVDEGAATEERDAGLAASWTHEAFIADSGLGL